MTANIFTKGYDDSETLKAMAAGLINRKFSSVDEAARSLIGESSGSNVDRLRRKYREQNWHQKGLDEYVEAEIVRRAVALEGDEGPKSNSLERHSVHRLMILKARWFIIAFGLIVLLLAAVGGTVARYYEPAVTYADPNKAAEKARAGDFAVNAYKGMYDLAFGTYDDALKRNQRYFHSQAAYQEYVDDLTNTGFLAGINSGLKVYRNEIVGEPKVYDSLGEFAADFTVKRFTSTSIKGVVDCFRVHSFVIRNREPGLRSSEFSLIGRSRIKELPSCSPEELAKTEEMI